jgi:hypothetical protein
MARHLQAAMAREGQKSRIRLFFVPSTTIAWTFSAIEVSMR